MYPLPPSNRIASLVSRGQSSSNISKWEYFGGSDGAQTEPFYRTVARQLRSLPAIPAVPEVPDGRSGVASRRQSRCAQQLQSRRAHTPHGTAASDPSAHARMAYLRLCPGVAHVRICLRHPPDSVRAPPQDPARRGLAGDEARRALGQGGLLEGDAERLGGHRGRTLVVLLLRAPHGRDAEGLRSARGGEGQGAAGRGASREGS